jgi:peroxiredoxin Q/BCP
MPRAAPSPLPGEEEDVAMSRRALARVVPIVTLAAAVIAGPALALDVGQKAPDFTLNAPGGKQVKLADLLGKGPVVLYTFIGAFNGP